MIGVVWGLLRATLIGASDCVARVSAQRVSMAVPSLAVMGLFAAALTTWMLITGGWPVRHTYAWVVSAVSGLLNLFALYSIYTALARGPVSVASTGASLFSVIPVATKALASQPYVWQKLIAILMVLVGIAMLAR